MHSNRNVQIHEIVRRAHSYFFEFDIVHTRLPRRQIRVERWWPLKGLCLKVNFDVAFHAPTRRSCSRIVIRDQCGAIFGFQTVSNEHIPMTFAAEALSCFHAVCLGACLGLRDLIFEGDSLTVIRKLSSPDGDASTLGPYLMDIFSMAKQIPQCRFVHVPEEGNSVVHVLAMDGLAIEGRQFQHGDVPNFACQAMDLDRRSLESRMSGFPASPSPS